MKIKAGARRAGRVEDRRELTAGNMLLQRTESRVFVSNTSEGKRKRSAAAAKAKKRMPER